ncbi:hypothetical protein TGPRC2_250930 [Toxoplasma gondii TgCatPRC2]|uniref:Transmembrane protein n=3 Tax=Toxoplasma gondii TaxID=5811 RepID=A0A151H3T2_TOXGO|nr:hypothetical protein TGVAND_250930 [Toxoplasma gondii VAND]KYF50251.1 hypothetical protein TGARI_250930 [Toxoplasma gondii ARI]KYK64011.1 hypothetical protein TGPRC2_250930 [Toxoplasma gondii TgCatPRC2]
MAGTALLCLLNFFLSAHTPGGLSCDTESLAFSGELTFTRLPGTVRQNSTARHLQPHGRPTKVFIRISVHTKTPSTKRSNG